MQKAHVLYNDRVYTFRRMVKIDSALDNNPTEKAVAELAELSIRNRLCFEELEAYNATGKFKYKHPLIRQHSQRSKLEKLLADTPAEFLKRSVAISNNVTRYQSYLRRTSASPDERKNWEKQLAKHSETLELLNEILKEQNHERN